MEVILKLTVLHYFIQSNFFFKFCVCSNNKIVELKRMTTYTYRNTLFPNNSSLMFEATADHFINARLIVLNY